MPFMRASSMSSQILSVEIIWGSLSSSQLEEGICILEAVGSRDHPPDSPHPRPEDFQSPHFHPEDFQSAHHESFQFSHHVRRALFLSFSISFHSSSSWTCLKCKSSRRAACCWAHSGRQAVSQTRCDMAVGSTEQLHSKTHELKKRNVPKLEMKHGADGKNMYAGDEMHSNTHSSQTRAVGSSLMHVARGW